MKIVILGAGQVGSTVAHSLASEENDITVVDLQPALLADPDVVLGNREVGFQARQELCLGPPAPLHVRGVQVDRLVDAGERFLDVRGLASHAAPGLAERGADLPRAFDLADGLRSKP